MDRPDAPLGSVGYEAEANERGERYVWLPPNVVDRLRAQRRPGESYGDVIMRIAGEMRAIGCIGRRVLPLGSLGLQAAKASLYA